MTRKPLLFMRPKQIYDKSINIKMTQGQYETLSFASMKLEMTKSDLIRIAITEFLSKHL